MFYWAAFLGDKGKQLVTIFLEDLGFSPFVGFFRGLSPVIGAIKGNQIEMFKRLVENSGKEIPTINGDGESPRSRRANEINKYYFKSLEDLQSFEEGRKSTDNLGNNIMHHIFYVKE